MKTVKLGDDALFSIEMDATSPQAAKIKIVIGGDVAACDDDATRMDVFLPRLQDNLANYREDLATELIEDKADYIMQYFTRRCNEADTQAESRFFASLFVLWQTSPAFAGEDFIFLASEAKDRVIWNGHPSLKDVILPAKYLRHLFDDLVNWAKGIEK